MKYKYSLLLVSNNEALKGNLASNTDKALQNVDQNQWKDGIFVGTFSHAIMGNGVPIEVNLTEKKWITMGQTERITVEYGTLNHCIVCDTNDSRTRFAGYIQGNEYSGTVIQDGTNGGTFLLKRKYKKEKRLNLNYKIAKNILNVEQHTLDVEKSTFMYVLINSVTIIAIIISICFHEKTI